MAITRNFVSPGFIVGVPRSGTTLLASILNRHPEVCVTPESHFFRLLNEYRERWKDLVEGWPASGMEFLRQIPPMHFDLFGLNPSQVVSSINRPMPSYYDLFMALGDSYANKRGKSAWIEKTPDHIDYLLDIRSYFPESKILHLVRDGRDVALSLCESGWPWQSESYVQNLLQWSNSVTAADNILELDPKAYTVRYEDLVSDPSATMQHVCDFLGISFHPYMLVPDGSEKTLIEKENRAKWNVLKPVIGDYRYRWKNTLSRELKLLSRMIIGEQLAAYGYSLEPRHAGGPLLGSIPKKHIGDRAILDDGELEALIRLGFELRIQEIQIDPACVAGEREIFLTSSLNSNNGSDAEPKNKLQKLSSLGKLLKRCRHLRRAGTKLIWLYYPDATRSKVGRYQKMSQRIVSKYAFRVLCLCGQPNNCTSANFLKCRSDKVTHQISAPLLDGESRHLR